MVPKVSIIMSTYNNAAFLPGAFESVLGQSFAAWELLVINDNSSDSTKDILETFKNRDGRIIIWSNQANQGLTKNLNSGLSRATGDYIARIDSDDVWSDPHKLQKQVDFLNENPSYGLVGSWAEAFASGNKKSFTLRYPTVDNKIREELLLHNCFVHSSILARKANILAVGGYDLNWQYIEDYALWMKLGLGAKFANLPEIMVRYRVSSHGITGTKNKEQIRNALSLIKRYKRNYPRFYAGFFKWSLQYVLSFIGLTKVTIFLNKINHGK